MKENKNYNKRPKNNYIILLVIGALVIITYTYSEYIILLGISIFLYWAYKVTRADNFEYYVESNKKISKSEYDKLKGG